MPSFTSHFKTLRLVWLLGACAVMVWLLSAWYTLFLNPEVRCYDAIYRIKCRWAEQFQQTNKVVFYGGSSCDFSIDPQRLLEKHGLAAMNLGLAAGIGPLVLSRCAMSHTRPGDTLVVALEPGLLEDIAEPPSFGAQFSIKQGRPEWLETFPGQTGYARIRAYVELRPGGRHAFSLLGKLVLGKPLYRYNPREVHPGGWHETAVRVPLTSIGAPHGFSPDGRALLVGIREWAKRNGVKVFYSLPRGYARPLEEQHIRAGNARWLSLVAEIIPVLKDPALGVDTNPEHFADSLWHLNRTGTDLRTDAVAISLKEQNTWSVEELRKHGAR